MSSGVFRVGCSGWGVRAASSRRPTVFRTRGRRGSVGRKRASTRRIESEKRSRRRRSSSRGRGAFSMQTHNAKPEHHSRGEPSGGRGRYYK
eukprot:1540131-Rhodomonas_salina.2